MEAAVSVATGALQPVLEKLATLLGDEYKRFKGMRGEIRFLADELTFICAFLQKMPEGEDLDVQDKVWMNEVRELSYHMEDSIDDFMKRANDKHTKPDGFMDKSKDSLGKMKAHAKPDGFIDKIKDSLGKMKAHHQIGNEIKDMKKQTIEIGNRRSRYKISPSFANTKNATHDPRVLAMYNHASELVGINKPKAEIIKMLTEEDGALSTQPQKTKMVSIVGSGGMGKTTLANQVYQDLKGKFECRAFVLVSRNPDMMQILRTILSEVSNKKYGDTVAGSIQQLISRISDFLVDKRYLIVIDDIWDEDTWAVIKLAFPYSNNLGSRIITTTRIVSVYKTCCSSENDSIHQMEPLSDDDSKKLLYDRIFDSVSRCPHEFEQISSDIFKKCGGVPLAIITMASVLAGDTEMKTKDEWHALLKSIGHGFMEGGSMHVMWTTLSLSYYNLPPHLKTCLLYLSAFPVTRTIEKDRMVKKLIAERIITQGTKLSLEPSIEEVASQCLDELVNRNVVQPLKCNNGDEVITYHIQPMMRSLLRAMAIEENFAASFDGKDFYREHRMKVPHLSIDCPDSENLIELSSVSFDGGVRSLTVFGHANRFLLKHFECVRVLDLEGCKSIDSNDVEYICSMVLLKRLCLAKTDITDLPPQIGNLQYLEGLDVEGTQMSQLPPQIGNLQYLKRLYVGGTQITQLPPEIGNLLCLQGLYVGGTQITQLPTQIGKLHHLKTLDTRKSRVENLPDQVLQLTRLVHLLIGDNESSQGVKLPDGIVNLVFLQQLGAIDVRKCSASSLKELVGLRYLNQIAVLLSDEPEDARMNDALLSSLSSTSLTSLVVCSDFRLTTLQSSSTYNLICQKKLTVVRRFLKVPISITKQIFLGMLDIRVCKLEEDDLKILRELPRLQSLVVRLEVLPTKMVRISCEGFAKLESFCVDCRIPRVIFEKGAMPKLEHLELKLYAGSSSEKHMYIKHLLNLQKVTLRYYKWYATNKGVRDTTDAVETEVKEHQNEITLRNSEEDKDGKCNLKTEIFQENRDAGCSCSTMAEIEEEEERDGHVDGTDHILLGGDGTEGDLHRQDSSGAATANCSGRTRSKKSWSSSMKL